MCAFGATPNEDDATVPATWVPWSHWSGLAGPGRQGPPTQSAPARTRPSKSRWDASTQESRTATVTPAPERPADRALGTCTWSKFQVRCGAVPAAYAGIVIATSATAMRQLAHRPPLVIASPYDDPPSRGGDSRLACGHGARPTCRATAAAGGAR